MTDASRAPEPPDSWKALAVWCLVSLLVLGVIALGYWLGQLIAGHS